MLGFVNKQSNNKKMGILFSLEILLLAPLSQYLVF